MLKFWSVINCFFMHWTKKLTLKKVVKHKLWKPHLIMNWLQHKVFLFCSFLLKTGFYFCIIFSFTLESSMTSKQPYNTTDMMPENRNQMNNCNVADHSKGRWKVKNRPTTVCLQLQNYKKKCEHPKSKWNKVYFQ